MYVLGRNVVSYLPHSSQPPLLKKKDFDSEIWIGQDGKICEECD